MTDFQSLGLSEPILRAVEQLGFTTPSPIQQQAIPMLLQGDSDLVGLAQTGTGKTAAFGLPLAHLIDFSEKHTQGLIICPTRELCIQITSDLENYTRFISGANVVPVYGGSSIETQMRALKRGAQIIVATPGRLIDLMSRRAVKLQEVKYVVLDEADEMLNMGFRDDIDRILEETPQGRRVWLFSATMPREVAEIASRYMDSPKEIQVGGRNSGATNITHKHFVIDGRHRYAALRRLLDFHPTMYGLVFCNTRAAARDVAEKLTRDGYEADALHGDLSQAQRDYVMGKFRNRTLQVLVATDVASRGIDVNDISHVIHYQLPDDVENYTHRSGRTARAGRSGESLALVASGEIYKIREIEKITGIKFQLSKVPSGEEVCGQQLFALIGRVKDVQVDTQGLARFLPGIYEELAGYTAEDIIARFVSVEFNRFLEAYRNAPELNKVVGERSSSSSRSARNEYKRLFFSIGALDNLQAGDFLRFICDTTGVVGREVGNIDIRREFSFVEVAPDVADQIREKLNGTSMKGRTIKVEEAGPAESGGGSRRRSGGYKGGDGFRSKGGDSRRSGGDRKNSSFRSGGDRRSSSNDSRGEARTGKRERKPYKRRD